ncbi:MAG: hypothetical protein J2P45_31615 [Candidatus Dormibacteraeota bacterium]|nr:hypothetical protein [Candidatus Dormibacteraeota bacterium]
MSDPNPQIRSIPRDCTAARARLATAQRFADSAAVRGLHPEASFILYYDAARNALSAVLSVAGIRVVEGRGAHAITIREAGRLLGPTLRREIIAIDGARVARNRTEYDAQPVGQHQVGSIRRATLTILDACRRHVEGGCP